MQFTPLVLLSLALAITQALPTANADLSIDTSSSLDKRDGTIKVQALSACGGKDQGTTTFGTSGRCINLSNAGAFRFYDRSDKHCDTISVQYYKNTGCGLPAASTMSLAAGHCYGVAAVHGSAFMKCSN